MAEENAVITPEAESSEVNLSEQMKIRREKLFAAQSAGKNPYEIVSFNVTAYSEDIKNNFEELEGSEVNIAGRMMSRRDMGKANFIDIADSKGRIQVYLKKDDLGDEVFADYKTWDIGDIVGLTGKVFRTRRGEISVHTTAIKLLSKSLIPLP